MIVLLKSTYIYHQCPILHLMFLLIRTLRQPQEPTPITLESNQLTHLAANKRNSEGSHYF